jgi:hypothetical protein
MSSTPHPPTDPKATSTNGDPAFRAADSVVVPQIRDLIPQKIRAYHGATTDEHPRYRSWEHCYGYFRRRTPQAIAAERDHAALQLAFYLASWGMYRGTSFLLQRAYTVHLGVVEKLTEPPFAVLWEQEFGGGANDTELLPIVLKAADAVRKAYKPFAPATDSRQPSDTLVTKVLLGTLGCLPACDRYFIAGFKSAGLSFSSLNAKSLDPILQFCHDNLAALRIEQARIEKVGGIRYPLMKLVDMYFWQTGFERSTRDLEAQTKSS